MTTGEAVSVVSMCIAGLALVLNFARDRRSAAANRQSAAAESQAIRDKLDYISDTTRDTREDVRALDRKLDDHASRIGKIEIKMDEHTRRLDRLENKEAANG